MFFGERLFLSDHGNFVDECSCRLELGPPRAGGVGRGRGDSLVVFGG